MSCRIDLAVICYRPAQRLIVGGYPDASHHGVDVDALVLCANEWQPSDGTFKGAIVLRCPMYDRPDLSPETWAQVEATAASVLRLIQEGKTVAVTCGAGRNRSGIVAARVLQRIYGWGAGQTIAHMRSMQPLALTNNVFAAALNRPLRLGKV